VLLIFSLTTEAITNFLSLQASPLIEKSARLGSAKANNVRCPGGGFRQRNLYIINAVTSETPPHIAH